MATHAAMVTRMDDGVGRIVRKLEQEKLLDDTLILFLSDNGASPEAYENSGFDRPSQTRDGRKITYPPDKTVPPGGEDTFFGMGPAWANVAEHAAAGVEGRAVRGRHLHAAHRALAARNEHGQGVAHPAGRPRDRRDADVPRPRRRQVPDRGERASHPPGRRQEPPADPARPPPRRPRHDRLGTLQRQGAPPGRLEARRPRRPVVGAVRPVQGPRPSSTTSRPRSPRG